MNHLEAADHGDIFVPHAFAETRKLLGWEPTHPGLIADLEDGHYFTTD